MCTHVSCSSMLLVAMQTLETVLLQRSASITRHDWIVCKWGDGVAFDVSREVWKDLDLLPTFIPSGRRESAARNKSPRNH